MMGSQQQTSQDPKSHKTSQNQQQQEHNKRRAAKMENLKAAVVKLFNEAPNKPLSESHNALLQERLNHFFGLLHTPDHPPYAWMIERAIQELNEKAGSSEESISKFIREEYADLPWAHSMVLKHHLAVLCEGGRIVLTPGGHYMLPVADSSLESSQKCRKKHRRRKRQYDWENKQRKRLKKTVGKENLLQKEDESEQIQKHWQSFEKEKLVASKDVHEKHNCMTEGLQEKKLEAEIRKKTTCLTGENGVISNSCAQSSVLASLLMTDGKELSANIRVQQKNSDSAGLETIDIHAPDARMQQDMDLLEGDHAIVSTPERPPGFESATTCGIILQQIKNAEHLTISNQGSASELCSPQKISESESITNTTSVFETEAQNLAKVKEIRQIVFQYHRRRPRADTEKVVQIKDDNSQNGQLQHQGQQYFDENPAEPFLCLWQHQLQEHELSNTNDMQEVQSGASNGLECPELHDKQLKRQESVKSQRNETVTSDAVIILDETKQEKLTGSPVLGEYGALKTLAAKPLFKKCHEPKKFGEPEAPTLHNQTIVSSKLAVHPKQLTEGDASDISDLQRLCESELLNTEEPLQTERVQRQRKRGCKRLSNLERPQREYQEPAQSTQFTVIQRKLRSWQQKNAEQPKVQQKLCEQPPAQSTQVAVVQRKLRTWQQKIAGQPKVQRKLCERPCRGRPPKPKPDTSILRDSITSIDLHQQDHEHPEQQGFSRPPKGKLDATATDEGLLLSVPIHNPHLNAEQPKVQQKLCKQLRRGRPRKTP